MALARPVLQHLRCACAVVAAGMAGIDGQFEPVMACDEDLYEKHARGESMPGRLPRDLWAALEALAADRVLRNAIGEAFCAQFLDLKRAEWTAYSQRSARGNWGATRICLDAALDDGVLRAIIEFHHTQSILQIMVKSCCSAAIFLDMENRISLCEILIQAIDFNKINFLSSIRHKMFTRSYRRLRVAPSTVHMTRSAADFSINSRSDSMPQSSPNNSAANSKSPPWKKTGPPTPAGRASSAATAPPTWCACAAPSRSSTRWPAAAPKSCGACCTPSPMSTAWAR